MTLHISCTFNIVHTRCIRQSCILNVVYLQCRSADYVKYTPNHKKMVQGPCAHLQLHETLTVVLYRVNVIINRRKLLLVQVMLLGVVHNGQDFH
jgi:hypothetical protein